MANYYSLENAGLASTPIVKPAATLGVGARLRRFRGTLTLATQLIADTWQITYIPAGSLFAFGLLTTSVTLGSSTLAIGIAGTTGKYRAAATFTAADTPTLFGVNTAVGNQTPLVADESIIGTVAAANLPASGTLVCDMYVSNG